jgi:DNA-binding winged helix-turn-helix (wHTH) protein/tetratricopeptide (TPR) repeat protein
MKPKLIRPSSADHESALKSGLLLYDQPQVTEAKTFSFDGWTVNPASGELGRDGKTWRLPQQPLRMLVELLEHAGEVVTRERMVAVLWPKGIVDFDNSLNAVVRKLRIVLADDAETPRYIETLPRIGYRFIAALGADAPPPAPEPPASRPSLAWKAPVVMTVLVTIALVWFTHRPAPPPAPVPAATSSPPQSTTAYPRRTTNERAYDLYLQGIFNRARRDINGGPLAITNFEDALKADPYYADAWAGLSEALSGTAMTMQVPVVPTYERARTAALRAVELDDKLGHGHAALAFILLMYDRDFVKAEAELELARAQDPGYGRIWHTLGLLRAFQGRVPEGLDAIRHARELEPTTLLYNSNYGLLLYEARRYDDAIAHAKLLLGSQPRLDQARSLLIRALVAKGDVEGALEQLPMRVDDRWTLSDAGFVYAHAGQLADARAEIARIERMGKEGYGVAFDIAVIQAALGDLPAACAALTRAIDDHSLRLLWMRLEPSMDAVRGEKCFSDVSAVLYK